MFLAVAATPPNVEIQRQLTDVHIDQWLREDVFQPRWWVLLALLIVSVYIWWKMIDKSRLPEIVLYAALAVIVIMGIVEYGEELTLWDYPTDIIPIFPPLTSINLITLPLIYSLIYQHFRTGKSFIIVSSIITGIVCFAIEPLLSWGRLYHLLNWKYYFNYPLYLLMSILVRAIIVFSNNFFEKRNLTYK